MFAGWAARGPFNHGLLSRGAELVTVGVSANPYESGQPPNPNPGSEYVCGGRLLRL
jgi:hypothetical protein